MKRPLFILGLTVVVWSACIRAEPGGSYTLTGDEKGVEDIIKADMAQHPDLYKGESLHGYIRKFKKENGIGTRRLSPGDQLRFPETMASLQAEKKSADAEGAYADIFCKRKSDSFRDGAELFTGSPGASVHLINVPEKYKAMKITKSVYKSTEPVEFKVKQAGLVLIACHEGISKKYKADGWSVIEKLDVYDNNAAADQYTALFVLLGKHHDAGTYEVGGETLFGGIHLVH